MGWRFWRSKPPGCAGFDDCRELQAFFQEYVDDELDEAAAARVAERLEACRGCGLEAGTYREIKRSIGRMERPPTATIERLETFARSLDDRASGDHA